MIQKGEWRSYQADISELARSKSRVRGVADPFPIAIPNSAIRGEAEAVLFLVETNVWEAVCPCSECPLSEVRCILQKATHSILLSGKTSEIKDSPELIYCYSDTITDCDHSGCSSKTCNVDCSCNHECRKTLTTMCHLTSWQQ